MVFRKIYWVVESLDENGCGEVKGIFTSIPDLMDTGLSLGLDNVRLTLAKLDSGNGILGQWSSPDFEGMREALTAFIKTGEFAIDQCDALCRSLKASA